jgi:hypothetical protein
MLSITTGTIGSHWCSLILVKTHCKRGHEFTEENTYVRPNGRRQCRICTREQRKPSTATQCRKGHPYPENLMARGHGCYVCHREAQRLRYLADPEIAERARKRSIAWQRDNRERYNSRRSAWAVANRRTTPLSDEDRQQSVEYVNILKLDPCSYCGGSLWSNLTSSCAFCNQSKSALSLIRFLHNRSIGTAAVDQ